MFSIPDSAWDKIALVLLALGEVIIIINLVNINFIFLCVIQYSLL